MRILFVSPYFPYPPLDGGRIRIYNLLRETAKSHDVYLVALAQQADYGALAHLGTLGLSGIELFPYLKPSPGSKTKRLLRRSPALGEGFFSPELRDRLATLLASGQFDICHVEELVMASYFLGLQSTVPVVLDRQKVDYRFYWSLWRSFERNQSSRTRLFSLFECLKVYDYERRAARIFKDQVAVSKADKRSLDPFVGSVAVVPNGVDANYFSLPQCADRFPPSIVFVGTMNYQPNIDAMRFFFSSIYPLLRTRTDGVHVYIVGRDPVPEVMALNGHNNIVVTGSVADVRPYLRSSILSFVPLRIGGGIRNKILESMAARCPVVSTSIGAEGIEYGDWVDILVADDPAEFTERIAALAGDATLRQRIAGNARQLVELRYNWSQIAQQMAQVYLQVAGKSPGQKTHE